MAKLYLGTTLIKKVIFGLVELVKFMFKGTEITIDPVTPAEPSNPTIKIINDGKGLLLEKGLEYKYQDFEHGGIAVAYLADNISLTDITSGGMDTWDMGTSGFSKGVNRISGNPATSSKHIWYVIMEIDPFMGMKSIGVHEGNYNGRASFGVDLDTNTIIDLTLIDQAENL